MKNFLTLILLLSSTCVFAQDYKVIVHKKDSVTYVDTEDTEEIEIREAKGATSVRIVGMEINIINDKVKINQKKKKKDINTYWEGLEFGFNTFVKEDYSNYTQKDFMDLRRGKSITVRLNLIEINQPLLKKSQKLGLITGLGLDSKDFRFKNRNISITNTDGITKPYNLDYDQVKKSKLNVLYLNVPLFLEYRPFENNPFHIAMGVEGGFRIKSHTKIKYKQDGKTHKTKERDDFNLNDFKLDAQVRIGYGGITIFASYGLVDFFKSGSGPQMRVMTFGFRF